MNVIFTISLIISGVVLFFFNPTILTLTVENAVFSSLKLMAKLLPIYGLWLAVFEVLNNVNLTKKLQKATYKPIKWLFGDTYTAREPLSISISANLLGLSGVATPMGIKAMEIFDQQNNYYGKSMLFVISATSIQLFPTTVISLMESHGALNPASIILPTLLTTLLSTTIGVLLVKIFIKNEK